MEPVLADAAVSDADGSPAAGAGEFVCLVGLFDALPEVDAETDGVVSPTAVDRLAVVEADVVEAEAVWCLDPDLFEAVLDVGGSAAVSPLSPVPAWGASALEAEPVPGPCAVCDGSFSGLLLPDAPESDVFAGVESD